MRKVNQPARRIDSGFAHALAETAPDEGDDDDEDVDAEPFTGIRVIARLREALAKLGTRIVDVFKQWDENSDGVITREEFQKAMPLIGLDNLTALEIEKLFALFDPDQYAHATAPSLSRVDCDSVWTGMHRCSVRAYVRGRFSWMSQFWHYRIP